MRTLTERQKWNPDFSEIVLLLSAHFTGDSVVAVDKAAKDIYNHLYASRPTPSAPLSGAADPSEEYLHDQVCDLLDNERWDRLTMTNAIVDFFRPYFRAQAPAAQMVEEMYRQLSRFGRLYGQGTVSKTPRGFYERTMSIQTGDDSWVQEARDTCVKFALFRAPDEVKT